MLRIATIGMLLVITGSASVTGAQMNVMSHSETVLQMEQKRMRQVEQQKQLKADTDKLVVLTAALKEQVDAANKDVLSIDMLKKAEQIEKLARSVKERIKE
jgi:hypothetical protein